MLAGWRPFLESDLRHIHGEITCAYSKISCDFQTILMIAEVQACDGSGAAPTRRPTGVA